MNQKLKERIEESGQPQYKIAHEAGLYYSSLSHIVNEVRNPSEREKQALANVLSVEVTDIFPEGNNG